MTSEPSEASNISSRRRPRATRAHHSRFADTHPDKPKRAARRSSNQTSEGTHEAREAATEAHQRIPARPPRAKLFLSCLRPSRPGSDARVASPDPTPLLLVGPVPAAEDTASRGRRADRSSSWAESSPNPPRLPPASRPGEAVASAACWRSTLIRRSQSCSSLFSFASSFPSPASSSEGDTRLCTSTGSRAVCLIIGITSVNKPSCVVPRPIPERGLYERRGCFARGVREK